MHNNYYFLRSLSKSVEEVIKGMEISTCFSQNKNELILGFTSTDQTFYIKAHLQSDFCCLTFPKDFQRSRKNSVDLFKSVIHKKIANVHQYINERCFSINFENDFILLFKMHGNRSNVLLFENDLLTERFNHHLKNDETLSINHLDRVIERSQEVLERHQGNYKVLYPTFGKHIQHYLGQKDYDSLSIAQQWNLLQSTEKLLLSGHFYFTEKEGKSIFSLLPIGDIIEEFTNPITAVNSFFYAHIAQSSLLKEKQEALSILEKKINRTRSYIEKSEKKLQSLIHDSDYSQWADIIMANLSQIPPHVDEITLQNIYDNLRPITIKLKPKLSPQKNAETYYRKSKNQRIQVDKLQESLDAKIKQLSILKAHQEEIFGIGDLKSLRSYLKEQQLTKAKQAAKEVPKPYHQYQLGGFDIWIGKNAKHNDTLTQKLSYKEDLWLHAKDVSGSHVLIKHKSGKPYPKHVIEYAAQLAAYYSKRKTDSLCPVIYTPKKFVRKLKGAPAGAVIVDKEQVILVAPIRKGNL